MKKLIGATCIAVLSPVALADTILGVYAGVGSWNADYDGDTGAVSVDLDELGLEDETNNFFYVALEHPIPFLPNIRVQHTNITSKEQGQLTTEFRLDDITFGADESVVTDLDLSHTDATFYYELADNWVNFDLGLTFRLFDGQASVSTLDGNISETAAQEGVVPMIYARAQFDLPLTGLSVGGAANVTAYRGNSLTDFSAYAAYAFDAVVDLGVEVGYRRLQLELEDLDDLETDLSLGGPYAALTMHF